MSKPTVIAIVNQKEVLSDAEKRRKRQIEQLR